MVGVMVFASSIFWGICTSLSLFQLLLLLCLTHNSNNHVVAFSTWRCPTKGFALFSSPSDGDYRNNLDAMRSILEGSWNAATMGSVPTTPESAAEAAALAVSQAMEDVDNNSGIYLVDILLPSMDVSQKEVYDGSSGVEFCIALSQTLHRIKTSKEDNTKNNTPRSAIFMNNNAMLQSVQSKLDAKKKKEETNNQNNIISSIDTDLEDDNDELTDNDDDVIAFDDFSDFEEINSLSLFNELDDDDDDDLSTTGLDQSSNSNSYGDNQREEDTYRLGSLFGDATIRGGTQMVNQVLESVNKNVVMEPDENILILLSPTTQEEMIAVRSLVTKYNVSSGSNDKKVIIIINNKLNPTPRELLLADTVYSMLPLIARASNAQQQQQQIQSTQPAPPKIVLMRRYPNDWEVFIDSNSGEKSGFQLAGSTPAHSVGKRGPSMDFIADCVKRYMSLKYGER